MRVSDMPKELYDKIRQRFDDTKEIRLLNVALQNAQKRGDYAKALYVAQQLDSLWTISLEEYIEKAEKESEVIDTAKLDIPLEDKDEMVEKMIVMFMCFDIIESATIDLNDVLRRTHPDKKVTTFTDLQQTLDLAKSKLKYLQETGGYMDDMIWIEKCDNMYDMMKSKAKSIVNKCKHKDK